MEISTINEICSLPHSFALVGAVGSGKHTLIDQINRKFFDLPFFDITENLNENTIDCIYLYPQKRLYVINVSEIDQRKQNTILKLLEEPYNNTYVALLVENIHSLLLTIRNRVVVYELPKYSIGELKKVAEAKKITIDDKYFGTAIYTPGDVLRVDRDNVDLSKIDDLCVKIVYQMKLASFPNALSILNKINFGDEYDKIDWRFFIRYLYWKYCSEYLNNKGTVVLESLKSILEAKKRLSSCPKADIRRCLVLMLVDLWRLAHGLEGTQGKTHN